MPLQHSSAEAVETATVYGASVPETTPQVSEPIHDAARYDTATVKEILARAEAMQAHHRATLTPDAIIALGQEVGVEPEFVRRALAATQTQTAPAEPFAPVTRKKRQTRVRRVGLRRFFTRRQRAATLVPPALYTVLMPFTFPWFANENRDIFHSGMAWLYRVLPAALGFYLAFRNKSRAAGAFGGGLFGLAALVTCMENAAFRHWGQPGLGEFLLYLILWPAIGCLLGVAGASLHRLLMGGNQSRKRLRVRFVVESEEINDTSKGEWV